jgi:hypothetical protein
VALSKQFISPCLNLAQFLHNGSHPLKIALFGAISSGHDASTSRPAHPHGTRSTVARCSLNPCTGNQ